MLPFTKSTSIALAAVRGTDNDVSEVAEPADGTYSLEANSFEQFTVDCVIENAVGGAPSVAVQWYGKNTADGDVTDTWTVIGPAGVTSAVTVAGAAAAKAQCLSTSIHSRDCTKRYVTALVTFTFADQGQANAMTTTLRGEIARRDV